ncbi:HIT domain-containing protein [Sulfurisphaera ohwakuensis]|uniref:ATP adenylyltransferase n=1 Tax=Sulfurisphaera ohwakuensis TaxID=69656 RepID=A0A650CE33_SULOH|nr:HIT domain-containing protein [Sulfurisphaera ohwakuensis]MBB5253161.1 ATP adenylyltransferase [Sulfurisphaera ohwakuensis]QGR15925.1 HIT domain-containing protein [Sulfurisphaera ohwakuensis]
MDILWAPWRSKYVSEASKNKSSSCLFCDVIGKKEDKNNWIVYRGKFSFIILNAFPYNPGHLMVVPYKHVSSIEGLEEKEILEMMYFLKVSIKAIRKVYSPDGFNIGINIGRVAGAGIDQHVHIHLVPRWNGDVNFMPVIGGVKVLPEILEDTYNKLKPEIEKIISEEALDL